MQKDSEDFLKVNPLNATSFAAPRTGKIIDDVY